MTDYPYEPPERPFNDTLLAFKDFELASTWGVRVENDPLGPVNKIVRLMRGQRRIASVLWPVPDDATVRLVRDDGYYSLAALHGFRKQLWDSRGTDQPPPKMDMRPAGWRVEVNGTTVLSVADSQIATPAPLRRPIPWRTRAQWRLRRWFYAAVDRVVVPLGYHHEDDCGDYR